VLDDVLDGFCTREHARAAYGVVVDLDAESVDQAATKTLRERMRTAPRGKVVPDTPAKPPRPAQAPGARLRQTRAPAIEPTSVGAKPSERRPTPPIASPRAAPLHAAAIDGGSLADALRGLRDAYGDAWSFEIVRHSRNGGAIEVVGELRANGATVRETAVSSAAPGRSLGELLELTGHDSLRKCVEALMRNGR
jgi:hypothetical protein